MLVTSENVMNFKRTTRTNIRCLHCDFSFRTSIDAMIDHQKTHDNSSFIKIGKHEDHNIFRPMEHHWDKTAGKHSFGGDGYRLHKIIPPPNVEVIDGTAKCRYCEYKVPIWIDGETAK